MHSSQRRVTGAKRSPLKAPPLRLAGQSVNEEMVRVRDDKVLDSLVVVVIAASMTLMAGLQWWFGTPPATLFFIGTMYLIGSSAYAFVRIRRARQQIHNLRLGRDGELAVAEYLETLARDGVRSLHDLIGDGFNVDHVAVTPQGLLAIETKTISKPADRDARVVFDGELITVGGYEPDRDPVVQARAAASWVKRQLKDALGREYPVRPVVAYPGWFVERPNGGRASDAWVLEPKAIGGFLRHEPIVLTDQDVSQIVYFLKCFVRAKSSSQ